MLPISLRRLRIGQKVELYIGQNEWISQWQDGRIDSTFCKYNMYGFIINDKINACQDIIYYGPLLFSLHDCERTRPYFGSDICDEFLLFITGVILFLEHELERYLAELFIFFDCFVDYFYIILVVYYDMDLKYLFIFYVQHSLGQIFTKRK